MSRPARRGRATALWAVRHGLPRAAVLSARRRGDLQATILTDPSARADPYPYYEEVRARGRLVRGRISTITVDHAVCTEVLRSDAFRAGFDTEGLPRWASSVLRLLEDDAGRGPVEPPSMVVAHPPDHTRLRRLVSRVFTARSVEAMRPQVEQVADRLLDDLAAGARDGEPVDLVAGYADLLPLVMIAEILGVPQDDRADLLRWGSEAAPSLDLAVPLRVHLRVDASLREYNAWIVAHLESLRRAPGDDLLSQLVSAHDGEEVLSDTELVSTASLLLAAGFETTVNLLGSGAALLAETPEQRDALLSGDASWAGAVEEVLRFEPPVQVTGRQVLRDHEVAGTPLRAGSFVSTMIGGANRDPEVFSRPQVFDVTRPEAREHLTFSSGIHYCLGAALARLEGEVGLRRLFERFPDLAVTGAPVRRSTRVLRGYESLPVRLGRAPVAA